MKVLVLIDAWYPFVGGAQVQIRHLKELLSKKYNCHYYILHSPSSHILIRFLWSIWVVPQAILLHAKVKFDLIHAHAYWPGIPGKILSVILNIPIVFTVHGSNLMDLKIKSPKAWLEKIILTQIKYDWIITVASNFLKYKNINKNIAIIPNGVDIKKFDKIVIKKKPPFKILFVGRDDSVKGLKYLQQAMKIIQKEVLQVRLITIQKDYSEEQLIQEYKKSHLFVLPSLSEGQPLTLLEAMAAKLPVVATLVGDNSKLVRNGFNGYLVKPGDAQDLAEKIIKVLTNKQMHVFGIRGYSLVKRLYTWDQCADKTWEIYISLRK